jgi:hypothetical protein
LIIDGQTSWSEGCLLPGDCLILAIGCFHLPE